MICLSLNIEKQGVALTYSTLSMQTNQTYVTIVAHMVLLNRCRRPLNSCSLSNHSTKNVGDRETGTPRSSKFTATSWTPYLCITPAPCMTMTYIRYTAGSRSKDLPLQRAHKWISSPVRGSVHSAGTCYNHLSILRWNDAKRHELALSKDAVYYEY